MRACILTLLPVLAALLVGCVDSSKSVQSLPITKMADASRSTPAIRRDKSIAGYPDRGELLVYEKNEQKDRGGHSWQEVHVSEAHALRSIDTGSMMFQAPNGEMVSLRYSRYVEHPNGNWTWIGYRNDGTSTNSAIITFGERAVFASIPYRPGRTIEVTTHSGKTWAAEADGQVHDVTAAAAQEGRDYLEPSQVGLSVASAIGTPLPKSDAEVSSGAASPAAAGGIVSVDAVIGYTSGLAASLGGQSQATTRVIHLVEIANLALRDSQVEGVVRVVHTRQVDYPDDSSNQMTLFQLTGVSCTNSNTGNVRLPDRGLNCSAASRPAPLQELVTAREQYGADVVSLVRVSAAESGSCGTAWLLGAGQTPITSASTDFAFSVVSDGVNCRDDYLAHELGHNFGLQHERATAQGGDDTNGDNNLLDPEEFGAFSYAFGHSTDTMHTIMAVRRAGQTGFRVFSNPGIACGGERCGIEGVADNALALRSTLPLIAAFRQESAAKAHLFKDINGDGRADMFWSNRASERADWWHMNGAAWALAGSVGVSGQYRVAGRGDFDGDGRSDVLWENGSTIWLWRSEPVGGFSVHFIADHPSAGWTIAGVDDINGDGRADVFWSNRTLQRADWWLMNGAAASFGGSQSVPAQYWVAGIGDFDGDNRSDILWEDGATIWLWRSEPSGGFSVHFIANHPANGWAIAGVDDINADGRADLFWNNRNLQRADWWFMNGAAATFGGSQSVPAQYWVAGLGDFNGDSRSDVIWEDGATIWLWRSEPAGGFAVQFIANHPANGWRIAP